MAIHSYAFLLSSAAPTRAPLPPPYYTACRAPPLLHLPNLTTHESQAATSPLHSPPPPPRFPPHPFPPVLPLTMMSCLPALALPVMVSGGQGWQRTEPACDPRSQPVLGERTPAWLGGGGRGQGRKGLGLGRTPASPQGWPCLSLGHSVGLRAPGAHGTWWARVVATAHGGQG